MPQRVAEQVRLTAAAVENAPLLERVRRQKAATDAAEDLILNLTREMNQARQDGITTEIMEIVGGAEAMGDDDDVDLAQLLEQNQEASSR